MQKQAARHIGIVFIVIMTAIFIYVIINHQHYERQVKDFVVTYGYGGIFAAAFILDLLMQPIGPDVPLIGGIIAGMNPLMVLIVVTTGSITASSAGYLMGYLYGEYGIKKIYGEKKYLKWRRFFQRWGKWSLLIAALTPVPYVPLCWTSGIFNMRFFRFAMFAFIPRAVRLLAVMGFTLLFL